MSDLDLQAFAEITTAPQLSAVVCTFNRAELLAKMLESLCRQSLPREQFEIVVINDGSTDDTEDIVRSFKDKLPLRYLFQKNAGLAAAKNHGLFASRGDFVLFLDDDDMATETLFEEHVKTHREYPSEQYAMLGYTRLSPEIVSKPLMHFVVEVGCFLFSYPILKPGEILDYTFFWGGRSSCKRSFLLEYGVFNPVFRFGCEDIELGYRLAKQGLRVIYNEHAVSVMVRDIDFAGFCRRLERQGNSNYVFSRLHPVPEIVHWTETGDADSIWQKVEGQYEKIIQSAGHLDEIANLKLANGFELDDTTLGLLHRGYRAAFKACKVKGIIEKKRELSDPSD
jgi:glycosyltransferase involved in cell wall biosynthesis